MIPSTSYSFLANPKRLFTSIRSVVRNFFLSLDDLQEILTLYNLTLEGRPVQPKAGIRNATLIVNTNEGKKVIKRYKESLGESTIIQEHSIVKYLAENDFPAVRLIPDRSRQTLIYFKNHRYALFEYIKGFRMSDYILFLATRRQFIASAGQLLGRLHCLLKHFTPDGFNPDGFNPQTNRRWRDTEWFLNKIKDIRNKFSGENYTRVNKLYKFIFESQNLCNSLTEVQKQLRQAELPRQIIHKDFGPSNVIFRKNEEPVVIDFEIARLDWRIIDLIDGWERFCNSRTGLNKKSMKIFLDAYQKEVCLSEKEFKNIPLVWNYLNLTGCIFNFHKFCTTGSRSAFTYACRFLEKTNWKSEDYNLVQSVTHQAGSLFHPKANLRSG